MKLLFLTANYWPDQSAEARLLADLTRDLAAAGHQIQVLSGAGGYLGNQYPAAYEYEGLPVRRLPMTHFGKLHPFGRLADAATFQAAALWHGAGADAWDAVLCSSTPPTLALIAARLARRAKAKFIYWVHDVYPEALWHSGAMSINYGVWLGLVIREVIRRADKVVAFGERQRRYLIEHHQVAPENCVAIAPWADGEKIRPLPPGGSKFRELHLRGADYVVMYCGNLGAVAEFSALERLLEQCRGQRGWRFVFVGDGRERPRVETWRRRFEGFVQYHPYRTAAELSDCLAAADVHLVTLKRAMGPLSVPSKVAGALAAGRPVLFIGPEYNDAAAAIAEGHAGGVYDPGETAAIARQLVEWHDHPEGRWQAGLAARALHEARFSRPRAAAAWRELFATL